MGIPWLWTAELKHDIAVAVAALPVVAFVRRGRRAADHVMRQGLVSLYDPAAASLPDEQGCKSAFDRIGFDYLSEHLQTLRTQWSCRPELGVLHTTTTLDGSCQTSIWFYSWTAKRSRIIWFCWSWAFAVVPDRTSKPWAMRGCVYALASAHRASSMARGQSSLRSEDAPSWWTNDVHHGLAAWQTQRSKPHWRCYCNSKVPRTRHLDVVAWFGNIRSTCKTTLMIR